MMGGSISGKGFYSFYKGNAFHRKKEKNKIFLKKFGQVKKSTYLCSRF